MGNPGRSNAAEVGEGHPGASQPSFLWLLGPGLPRGIHTVLFSLLPLFFHGTWEGCISQYPLQLGWGHVTTLANEMCAEVVCGTTMALKNILYDGVSFLLLLE